MSDAEGFVPIDPAKIVNRLGITAKRHGNEFYWEAFAVAEAMVKYIRALEQRAEKAEAEAELQRNAGVRARAEAKDWYEKLLQADERARKAEVLVESWERQARDEAKLGRAMKKRAEKAEAERDELVEVVIGDHTLSFKNEEGSHYYVVDTGAIFENDPRYATIRKWLQKEGEE